MERSEKMRKLLVFLATIGFVFIVAATVYALPVTSIRITSEEDVLGGTHLAEWNTFAEPKNPIGITFDQKGLINTSDKSVDLPLNPGDTVFFYTADFRWTDIRTLFDDDSYRLFIGNGGENEIARFTFKGEFFNLDSIDQTFTLEIS